MNPLFCLRCPCRQRDTFSPHVYVAAHPVVLHAATPQSFPDLHEPLTDQIQLSPVPMLLTSFCCADYDVTGRMFPDGHMRVMPHTDMSALTLLFQRVGKPLLPWSL